MTSHANSTTDIDVRIAREGKNLKRWVLGFVLRTIAKRLLDWTFQNTVKAIEALNDLARDDEACEIKIFVTQPVEVSS